MCVALGFHHMHSAYDRDNFIKINWDNMPEHAKPNFAKYGSNEISHFGETYDLASVMHYGAFAFSNNGKPTIEPLVKFV